MWGERVRHGAIPREGVQNGWKSHNVIISGRPLKGKDNCVFSSRHRRIATAFLQLATHHVLIYVFPCLMSCHVMISGVVLSPYSRCTEWTIVGIFQYLNTGVQWSILLLSTARNMCTVFGATEYLLFGRYLPSRELRRTNIREHNSTRQRWLELEV